MKVLVTGASGLIGRNALLLLINSGFEVHALCRTPKPSMNNEVQLKLVNWHYIDLMQAEAVDSLFSEIQATYLLHLAWYTEHGKFWYSSENLNWVAATLGLLTSFVRHGGERVVMAGSCAEYDWSEGGACVEEVTLCKPATLYGVSKHALCEIVQSYCEQNKVSFAWGRVFFLFGPGEDENRFIPAIINALLRGEKVPCSEGNQVRDFMHATDVASAFVSLLASDLQGSLNVASGQAYSLRQIGEYIMSLISGDGSIDFGALPNRIGEPEVLTADVMRLQQELHWSPSLKLEEGLAGTVQWWRNKFD